MANYMQPWKSGDPSSREHLITAQTNEHENLTMPSSYHLRADAMTYRPTAPNFGGPAPGRNAPPSPYHDLQTHTTFIPPDTPNPSLEEATFRTRATGGGTHGQRFDVHNRTSSSGLAANVGDLFHGLGSIWATPPKNGESSQMNGKGDTEKNISSGHEQPRPRSRSELPVGFSDRQSPYAVLKSGNNSVGNVHTPSRTNSGPIASPPNYMKNVIAPSPRGPATINPRFESHELDRYDTPGGVPLPTGTASNTSSPSRSATPSAKLLAEFIKSGGAEPYRRGVAPVSFNAPRPEVSQMAMPMQAQQLQVGWAGNPGSAPEFTPPPPDPLVQTFKNKGGPNMADMVQNVAFFERARVTRPANYGVIKLTDIPYTTTKPEIVALIGERAPMVSMPPDSGSYAIHIIMERGTAKSMDAFVEFETLDAAQQVVSRLEKFGRPMIQARRVNVKLSSQEALMRELFPRAKCVRWDGSQPVIKDPEEDFSAGFQGFVSSEELVMTVKVAQNPQRSRFAIKHQQRTYESMISLMFKYPWHMVDCYTISERNQIYKAVRDQIIALVEKLRRDGSQPPVDAPLLQELLDAGLKCPGFSESQRASLIDAAEGLALPRVYVTPDAPHWPFEVLARKENLSNEFVVFYASTLHKGSAPAVTSLAEMSAMGLGGLGSNSAAQSVMNPTFGNFRVPWPADKTNMTMAEAAKVEWDAVEHALRQAVRG